MIDKQLEYFLVKSLEEFWRKVKKVEKSFFEISGLGLKRDNREIIYGWVCQNIEISLNNVLENYFINLAKKVENNLVKRASFDLEFSKITSRKSSKNIFQAKKSKMENSRKVNYHNKNSHPVSSTSTIILKDTSKKSVISNFMLSKSSNSKTHLAPEEIDIEDSQYLFLANISNSDISLQKKKINKKIQKKDSEGNIYCTMKKITKEDQEDNLTRYF